ncbi:hypothetical protein HYT26_04865 [Candidatus Pacearchaeota archaeon]|nr:hypothetical protein [Candidatus Pacearchaeota archaeon]
MPIALEVARVSGAVRCNRWKSEVETSAPVTDLHLTILEVIDSIPEMVRDTRAYVKRTRREILKKLHA